MNSGSSDKVVRMAKIAIIGSRGIPANYGGFETLAENLVRHLGKKHEFIVYCSSLAYTEKPDRHLNAELRYIPFDANGWQSIPYDIWSMVDAARRADILLILGVSGCIFLPVLKLLSRKKIVVNLDGLDSQRPKWGRLTKTFLKLSETIAAHFADKLISDNDAIKKYIAEEYSEESFLVEYGGDNALCALPTTDNSDLSVVALHKSTGNERPVDIEFDDYAVAVCRIEPENNIHVILEAFTTADSLPLVFLGNWSVSEYGLQLRKKYAHHPKLQLLDPIFEPEKLFAIRSNASMYIHGHSSGGTNPSLVESMTLGLPVITFDVVFNRATTEDQALYFTDAENLATALCNLENLDLEDNAKRMREIAGRRYAWSIISSKYSNLFASVGGLSEAPFELEAVVNEAVVNETVTQPPPSPVPIANMSQTNSKRAV